MESLVSKKENLDGSEKLHQKEEAGSTNPSPGGSVSQIHQLHREAWLKRVLENIGLDSLLKQPVMKTL